MPVNPRRLGAELEFTFPPDTLRRPVFLYGSSMNSIAKTLVCTIIALAAGHSHAVYRCGNVFQDTPCDGGAAPKAAARPAPSAAADAPAAAPVAASKAATGVSPFAGVCARQGKSALDIVWKREAGALREAQRAKSPENGKLIDAVYDRRGSAQEISAQIEAECITEKQRAADAAAALAALQQAAGADAPATAPKPATALKEPSNGESAPKTAATADNKAQCANLRQQLTAVQDRGRQGGNVADMERINTDRRKIDQQISNAKC
jgi:hypothetical protein